MIEKILYNDGSQTFFKLTKRLALVLIILFVLGLSVFTFVLYKGGEWRSASYQNWTSHEFSYSLNPLVKLKALFQQNKRPPAVQATSQTIKVISEESQVIDIVKKASPAVVSIIATSEVPKMEQCYKKQIIAPGSASEFQDIIGDLEIPSWCQTGTEKKRTGAGSGFIVSEDGYIVTNKHVVSDEKAAYTVVLNDPKNFGKKVTAKILARDSNNDIAVLKINMDGLPYLTFGNSDKLQVGQTAIAIGYALGAFDNTVSKGVVSGLSRSVSAAGAGLETEQLRGLIQTDAAINPGNSGGPLLNTGGQVIGMNVATANAQSIGFAILGNLAKFAYEQVHTYGVIKEPERALLGVRYIPVTTELQDKNKLPYDYGMLVTHGQDEKELAVLPGSPADKAGITENDIILEINGKELNERYILSDALVSFKPGDEVELQVYHKGEVKKVKVKLEKK